MPEKFTQVKKGYDPFEVDKYIESLEDVIKSYKDKDAAIKNAILNAQIAADNIVKNAKLQASAIEKDATSKLDNIINSIASQKQMIADFEQAYNALIRKYIIDIDKTSIGELTGSLDELEEYINKLKKTPETEQ